MSCEEVLRGVMSCYLDRREAYRLYDATMMVSHTAGV